MTHQDGRRLSMFDYGSCPLAAYTPAACSDVLHEACTHKLVHMDTCGSTHTHMHMHTHMHPHTHTWAVEGSSNDQSSSTSRIKQH